MNQAAIQKRDERAAITPGTYREARTVNQIMESALQSAHLISPATSVGAMPEGCSIALSKVEIDLTRDAKGYFASSDTYDVGGKRGLSKTVLQKIGAALGVSWDPVASGRIDDGSDPYYCRWKAVGKYRSFDGQVQTIVGEKEMDLRDGSPQIQALMERYEDKLKYARPGERAPKAPTGQIREMRLHIQSHAETKAQLRALRSMGIKTSYTVEELAKPFVAARVLFTGQSDDPELRRLFAAKVADSFLDAQRSLYGGASAPPAVQATQPLRLSPPPPVGSVDDDEDYYEERPPAAAAQAPEAPPASAAAQQSARSGAVIPGGNAKGTPIEEASDRDLEYWANRLAGDLADGKSRNPQRDGALQQAMAAELAKRGDQPSGEY